MKQDVNALLKRIIAEDPWRLRVIGREAGLPIMRKQLKSTTNTALKKAIQACIKHEQATINAAKNKDQAKWDSLNADTTVWDHWRTLKNLTQ